MAYAGNKRNEVEGLYNEIKDKLKNIKTIVEPFCGSSAFSYYLSLQHPKKFKYILNDNNSYLIQLYKIMSNEEEIEKLITKLNILIEDLTKEKYNKILKEDNLESWFIKNKIYSIRPGLYPLDYKPKDFNDLKKCPIINFLKTEDIEFKNIEGVEIVEQYKDDNNALIFLDPPYICSFNDFYYNSKINIYEYLYNNPIVNFKALILLCLEDNWIIKLIFKNFIKSSYNKTYETTKKKTTHLIISN